MSSLRSVLFTIFTVTLLVGSAHAAEKFHFPEGKHGQGELKYVNGIPVLLLAGTPEEIGTQMGALGLRPIADKVNLFRAFLKKHRMELVMPLLVRFGERQLARWPDAYRREFEAMVKASGIERDLLLVGNTFTDLRYLAGCSALMIAPQRSTSGGSLMGRNLDYAPVPAVGSYQLLIVVRPVHKNAFAVIGPPGAIFLGCRMSGFNADGLAACGNDIRRSSDKAPQMDWSKMSTGIVLRRVLEECDTIDEAADLLRKNWPAERFALMCCDRNGGGVIEITPKSLVVRRGVDGICFGTNHFRSAKLAVPDIDCDRADRLAQANQLKQLSVADVAKQMHAVHQKDTTVHTFVLELNTLRLHVAFGDGKRPATAMPLATIPVGALLQPSLVQHSVPNPALKGN